jgi:hypothetical protein
MPGKKTLKQFEDEADKFAYTTLLQQYRDYNSDMYWEMKDGNNIKIKNMKDSHIKNTINMLRRKEQNGSRVAWIEILENEQLQRRTLKIDKIKENIDLDDVLRCKER